MGMSTYVQGFKPADAKWKRMKAVYDACEEAKVAVPDEVDDFFNGEPPDPAGVEVDEHQLKKCGAAKDWRDDSREGIEIDITKLPKDITVLRFVNSW